jgi:peptidoglycan/xylan/chitin deacetylase (PgdA/CDA1 family)
VSGVDHFWGLPPTEAVKPGEGEQIAAWLHVQLDGPSLGLPALPPVLLPELRKVGGVPIVTAVGADGDRLTLAAQRDDGSVELGFDPDEAVNALTTRAAMTPRPPMSARLPFPYHRVPRWVRRIARDVLVRRSSSNDAPFPAWPVEPSVEVIRRVVLEARRRVEPELEVPPTWPGGKRFALCLTQDVDTAAGVPVAVEMAAEQEARGLGGCWFVVGAGYELTDDATAALRSSGEIGLHDLHHDNRIAFMGPDAIRTRLDEAAPLIEALGIRGFRSPSMLRTPSLYDALEGRFAWDSSMPDTGLYPARNGCATVFPFMRRDLVVLPATIPPDGQLLGRGLEPDEIVAAWRQKVDWIAAFGGLAVHLAHPEPGFSAEPRMRDAYRRFLDSVAERDDAWVALPSEIATHWRTRASTS